MKWFIGIVIALIVIIGGWYYLSSSHAQTAQAPAPEATANTEGTEYATNNNPTTAHVTNNPLIPAPAAATPKTVTVNYTSSGFSPSTVTIKQGQSVTFVDQTGGGIWVASNQHPTHTQYSGTTRQQHCPDTSGTAFDQCSTGGSYMFTFQKAGTWRYHDHLSPDDTGTVIVQ